MGCPKNVKCPDRNIKTVKKSSEPLSPTTTTIGDKTYLVTPKTKQ